MVKKQPNLPLKKKMGDQSIFRFPRWGGEFQSQVTPENSSSGADDYESQEIKQQIRLHRWQKNSSSKNHSWLFSHIQNPTTAGRRLWKGRYEQCPIFNQESVNWKFPIKIFSKNQMNKDLLMTYFTKTG
jgi:hypothetical protein